MIVKMKSYEQQCVEYCKRYKSWEVTCAAKDSYLSGYQQALEDLKECITHNIPYYELSAEDALNNFINSMNQEVDVEFKDGEHQLIRDIK